MLCYAMPRILGGHRAAWREGIGCRGVGEPGGAGCCRPLVGPVPENRREGRSPRAFEEDRRLAQRPKPAA